MFFTLNLCFDGVRYVLQTFGCIGIDGECDGNTLLAIILITMKDYDVTLFGLADVHDAKIETIGRKADVIGNTDRELTHEGFLGGNTGAYHR